MTNLEYMRAKVLDMVAKFDETELRRLTDDTELSACGAEGIFSCRICEKQYGECSAGEDTDECSGRYADWCGKEVQR